MNRGSVEDRYVPRSGTKTCFTSLASLRSKIGTKAAEPPERVPSRTRGFQNSPPDCFASRALAIGRDEEQQARDAL